LIFWIHKLFISDFFMDIMVFTGLAKLVDESRPEKIDFSMLGEEDWEKILAGGQYPVEQIPEAEIALLNMTFSRRKLMLEANELISKGRFRDAQTKYIIAARDDLAHFLDQYSEDESTNPLGAVCSGYIQMVRSEDREEQPFQEQTGSGSFKMRKPDPRYDTVI